MKTFLDDNFLLKNKVAEELYHDYAAKMPIIDYHNHLLPQLVADKHQFNNITEAWLYGDHYKWRAMRANGIDEKYITGSATDEEKFQKWAETVPYTVRNPLYHWTHLELQRYFNISDILNGESASEIFRQTAEILSKESHSAVGLLDQMNVKVICTTDDPIDSLEHHSKIQKMDLGFKVYPSFRPDKALGFENSKEYIGYLDKLSAVSGVTIKNLDTLIDALFNRIEFFNDLGGRVSDLGFNQIPLLPLSAKNLDSSFQTILDGKDLEKADQIEALQGYVLTELCKKYHEKGWVQQFHLGALRNNNKRALRELGPDTGYDSMGDFDHAERLSNFLNNLDDTNQLTKTIIYNLNPRDNDLMATMVGNFNDGKIVGKMQFGTGWWFLDQKNGMEHQMNSLSNMGLLSRFVGMLTDSRSFLSFPRHEYFRRILCNLLGTDVVNGELPNDISLLSQIVEDICYNNAKKYFDF